VLLDNPSRPRSLASVLGTLGALRNPREADALRFETDSVDCLQGDWMMLGDRSSKGRNLRFLPFGSFLPFLRRLRYWLEGHNWIVPTTFNPPPIFLEEFGDSCPKEFVFENRKWTPTEEFRPPRLWDWYWTRYGPRQIIYIGLFPEDEHTEDRSILKCEPMNGSLDLVK
jgi:hypothetical protein